MAAANAFDTGPVGPHRSKSEDGHAACGPTRRSKTSHDHARRAMDRTSRCALMRNHYAARCHDWSATSGGRDGTSARVSRPCASSRKLPSMSSARGQAFHPVAVVGIDQSVAPEQRRDGCERRFKNSIAASTRAKPDRWAWLARNSQSWLNRDQRSRPRSSGCATTTRRPRNHYCG